MPLTLGRPAGARAQGTGRRTGIMKRLSTPKFMIGLGIFDFALGAGYAFQPKNRGSSLFLMAAGVALLSVGLLVRRNEKRRAAGIPSKREQKLAAKVAARKSSMGRAAPKKGAAVVESRARGPKAGSGKRLAGPTRHKPEEPEVRESKFRKKLGI